MVQVAISPGNSKLGLIPNVSLPPVVTCIPNPPCRKVCYAVRYLKVRRDCKEAYEANYELWLSDPDAYFRQIRGYLLMYLPRFWRWHVSGDIPDLDYFERMLVIAQQYPETRFLVFTKKYALIDEGLRPVCRAGTGRSADQPDNLYIFLSTYPGLPIHNPHNLRMAYFQDGTETRIQPPVHQCPRFCPTCKFCWRPGGNVVLTKH